MYFCILKGGIVLYNLVNLRNGWPVGISTFTQLFLGVALSPLLQAICFRSNFQSGLMSHIFHHAQCHDVLGHVAQHPL